MNSFNFPCFDKNDIIYNVYNKQNDTNEKFNIIVDIPKSLQSVEEFYEFLRKNCILNETKNINLIKEEHDIIINIINKKVGDVYKCYFYNNIKTNSLKFLNQTYYNIPLMERDKYKQLYHEANNALKLSAKLSANYVVNNKEQITTYLNERLNYITDLQKAKIQQKNRTTYLKKKSIFNIPSKTKMTEEQKKESKRLTNLKYYNKIKNQSVTLPDIL